MPTMSARSSASIRSKASSPELVAPGDRLDRAADVADVEEDEFAVAALTGDPAHQPVAELRVLALTQRRRVVRGDDLGGVIARQEAVRVGIDPFLAQPLDLGAALRLARARGIRGAVAARDALLVRCARVSRGRALSGGRLSRRVPPRRLVRHGARPTLTRSLPS